MLLLLLQNVPGIFGEIELVEVPDVVGQAQAAGASALEAEGFSVTVQTSYSSAVQAGLIISQQPAGGTEAIAGSAVIIVVSLGEAPLAVESISVRAALPQVHVTVVLPEIQAGATLPQIRTH